MITVVEWEVNSILQLNALMLTCSKIIISLRFSSITSPVISQTLNSVKYLKSYFSQKLSFFSYNNNGQTHPHETHWVWSKTPKPFGHSGLLWPNVAVYKLTSYLLTPELIKLKRTDIWPELESRKNWLLKLLIELQEYLNWFSGAWKKKKC